MTVLTSYPKVYQLGHKAVLDIFSGPVVIQEKIDGSQFSFGLVGGEQDNPAQAGRKVRGRN